VIVPYGPKGDGRAKLQLTGGPASIWAARAPVEKKKNTGFGHVPKLMKKLAVAGGDFFRPPNQRFIGGAPRDQAVGRF